MNQRIGLDSHSLMALIEVSSKTALLQNKIQAALNDFGAEVEFVTDAESVQDARQKVLDSYQLAQNGLDKAARVAEKTNQSKISDLLILTVKCWAERFPGHQILRWSDTLNLHLDKHDFFAHVRKAIDIKKEAYLSALATTDGMLTLRSDAIQPYKIAEFSLLPLNVHIKVIDNNTSWPDYLDEFEKMLKRLTRRRAGVRKSVTKIKDLYHLHSLYDAGIDQFWLCKSGFAGPYLRYLRSEPIFEELLEKVQIERP